MELCKVMVCHPIWTIWLKLELASGEQLWTDRWLIKLRCPTKVKIEGYFFMSVLGDVRRRKISTRSTDSVSGCSILTNGWGRNCSGWYVNLTRCSITGSDRTQGGFSVCAFFLSTHSVRDQQGVLLYDKPNIVLPRQMGAICSAKLSHQYIRNSGIS